MKKLIFTFLPLLFIHFNGCSNDGGTGANPFGAGGNGGGTGNVTFTVSVVQDGQGQQFFQFAPSTNVVVDQVRAQCTPQQIDETVQGDGQTVYSPNDGFSIGPIPQGSLQTGNLWTFTLQGKLESATGTAYNVNSTYTVP